MNILTKSFQGASTEAIILFFAALALYFFMEYKTKSTTPGFSLKYWFKDNWVNLAISTAVFVIFILGSDAVSAATIVLLGVFPNLAWDWIQSILQAKRTAA